MQARVLRTVDKCGGLDGYLLGEKPGRVKELGVEGWRLRWLVSRTGKVRGRMQGEREALGLVGRESGMSERGKARRMESAEADALEDEVGRASGEVVGNIQGSGEGSSEPETEAGYMETTLETRITRLTHALEAETARRASQPNSSLPATALPSQTDEPENKPPGRRYTKGEKRAWRAAQARQKLDLDSASYPAGEWGEEQVGKRVEEIEEAVEVAMGDADEEGRERLEIAMEGLRSAREELEEVGGEAVELRGEEKAPGEGVLGKIKGLFRRR